MENIIENVDTTSLTNVIIYEKELLDGVTSVVKELINYVPFYDITEISVLMLSFLSLYNLFFFVKDSTERYNVKEEMIYYYLYKVLNTLPTLILLFRYRYLIIFSYRMWSRFTSKFEKAVVYLTLSASVLGVLLAFFRGQVISKGFANDKTKIIYMIILSLLALITLFKITYNYYLNETRDTKKITDVTVIGYIFNKVLNETNLTYIDELNKYVQKKI